MITAAVNPQQMRELQAVLDPKQLKQALFQAATRTSRTLVKEIAKEATNVLNIKTAAAKEVIKSKVDRTDKAGVTISIKHRATPAIDFKGARASKKSGVSVRFRKDKPAMRFGRGFAATMKSGHKGFFQRKTPRTRRLPIKEIWGPSVYSTFVGNANNLTLLGTKMSRRAQELYFQNLISQVTGRFGARLPTSLAA